MESKVFEIEVEEKKGRPQATLVERKRGISSWVRLGPTSLGIFLESLNQCIKEVKAGRWKGDGREMGDLTPWCEMRIGVAFFG